MSALHTFLYYIHEHEKDDFKQLRNEPAIARIKRFIEDLDGQSGKEDYGLSRTTMLQIVDRLYKLFPELYPSGMTLG